MALQGAPFRPRSGTDLSALTAYRFVGQLDAAGLDVGLGFHGLCPPFFSDRRDSSFAFIGRGAENAQDRSPALRRIMKHGAIVEIAEVGGLQHRYERIAL